MPIYGRGGTCVNPSLNAVATVMLLMSPTAIAIGAAVMAFLCRCYASKLFRVREPMQEDG
jgi:hypothetical protein